VGKTTPAGKTKPPVMGPKKAGKRVSVGGRRVSAGGKRVSTGSAIERELGTPSALRNIWAWRRHADRV
jgi:hypothetical protein